MTTRSMNVFALVALICAACAGRVVIGGGELSPSKATYIAVDVATARGVGYEDRGRKTVRVQISDKGTGSVLFTKDFLFVGAAIDWNIHWKGEYEVEVQLLDRPTIARTPPPGQVDVLAIVRIHRAPGRTGFEQLP